MTIIFKRILPEIIREGNSGDNSASLYNIEIIDWSVATVFLDLDNEEYVNENAGPENLTSIEPAP